MNIPSLGAVQRTDPAKSDVSAPVNTSLINQADPVISTRQVAEQFGIHRSTLYRHLNARQKRSA